MEIEKYSLRCKLKHIQVFKKSKKQINYFNFVYIIYKLKNVAQTVSTKISNAGVYSQHSVTSEMKLFPIIEVVKNCLQEMRQGCWILVRDDFI